MESIIEIDDGYDSGGGGGYSYRSSNELEIQVGSRHRSGNYQ